MLQSLKLFGPRSRARPVTRFARLPLLARLCAAFALVYLFGAAVGVTGIVNLVDLRQRSDALYRQDMHGAISAERAQSALALLGRAQLSITMATSGSERDEAATEIDATLGRSTPRSTAYGVLRRRRQSACGPNASTPASCCRPMWHSYGSSRSIRCSSTARFR